MPSNFTPPSFHEDQPSALETALASQIGAHNPMSALGMLIPEAQRRSDAQGDYHDYMAQVNQQQLANLANNRQENQIKGLEQLSSHPILGSGALARSMGLLPQSSESEAYGQGLDTAASASNIKSAGEGLAPYMTAGGITTPQAMGQFIPHAPGQPAVTGVTDPALIRAAQVRGQYELAGHQVTAGAANKSFTEHTTVPDPSKPWDTDKTRIFGTPQAVTALSTPQQPPASPTGGGPTPAMIANKMSALASSNSYGHKKVVEAAAANGGKPVLGPQRPDGSGTLMGSDGIPY